MYAVNVSWFPSPTAGISQFSVYQINGTTMKIAFSARVSYDEVIIDGSLIIFAEVYCNMKMISYLVTDEEMRRWHERNAHTLDDTTISNWLSWHLK